LNMTVSLSEVASGLVALSSGGGSHV